VGSGSLRRGLLGELLRIARTPLRMALFLVPFVAWALCIAVYANRTPRQLRTGVLDQDHTTLSRTLVRDFMAAPALAVEQYQDLSSLRKDLRAGRVRAGIVIPDGTDEAVREGRTARIPLLRDATRTMPTTQIFTAVSTVISTEATRLSAARLMRAGMPGSAAREIALALRIDGRPLGNPWMDYLRSFSPVLLPMFLQMALMIAGGACATHLRRLRRRFQIGRVLAWAIPMALLGGGIEMFLADTVFSGLCAAGATAALCLASGLVGLGLGRILNDTQRAVQLLLVVNTPAFILSGFSFPEWAMPRLMEIVTRPLPFSLWLDFQLATSGAPDGHLLRGLLGLLAWTAIGLVLCLPRHATEKAPPPFPFKLPPRLGFLAIRGLATLVFAAPWGYFALYGTIYADKEETRVPVAITGAPASARNTQLARQLSAHPRLDARFLAPEEAASELRSGEVRAIVALDDDLDLRVRRGRSVSVPVIIHADRFLPVSEIQRAVSEVLGDANARIRAGIFAARQNLSRAKELAAPILLDDHPLGNPHETYGDYMLLIIGILITHQLLLISTGVVASARRHGVGSIDIPGRQTVLLWIWFSLAGCVWLTLGLAIFDVPTNGNLGVAMLQLFLSVIGAAGIGGVIGRLCGDPVWVMRLAAFTSYPLFFLSGASWPMEAMPRALRILAWFNPMVPLLDGTDRALRLGATFGEIAPALRHGLLVGVFWLLAAWLVGKAMHVREIRRADG